MEIQILDSSGSVLSTANFILQVKPSALSKDTAVSETDLSAIEKASQDAVQAAAQAKESASEAEAANRKYSYTSVEIPTTGWTTATVNGMTYYKCTVTLPKGYSWYTVSCHLASLPTSDQAAAMAEIDYITLDDSDNTTLRVYAAKQPTTAITIIVQGVTV